MTDPTMEQLHEHFIRATHSEYLAGRENYLEKNDCVVKSIAIALAIPYGEAHAICKKGGRKDRHGVFTDQILTGKNRSSKIIKGRRVSRHYLKTGKRIATFLRQYPKGRYICIKHRHAFAVVDGFLFGQSLDNSIIKKWYRVTMPKKDFVDM